MMLQYLETTLSEWSSDYDARTLQAHHLDRFALRIRLPAELHGERVPPVDEWHGAGP